MNTAKNFTATIFTLLITVAAFAQEPAQWTETTNWLSAWHQVAGNQASASWILDQTDKSTRYWVSNDGTSMVILTEADFSDSEEAVSDLEDELGTGSARLWLAGEVSANDPTNVKARFNGNLAGRDITAEKAHLYISGQWYTAVVLGQGSCNLNILAEVNDDLAQQLVEHMSTSLAAGTANK